MVCGCKKKKIIRWLQLAEHLFSRLPGAGMHGLVRDSFIYGAMAYQKKDAYR